jgi:hypothetical protein
MAEVSTMLPVMAVAAATASLAPAAACVAVFMGDFPTTSSLITGPVFVRLHALRFHAFRFHPTVDTNAAKFAPAAELSDSSAVADALEK